jgi:hypothetical protein
MATEQQRLPTRERRPSTGAPIVDIQGSVGPAGISRPKHKRTATGFGPSEIKGVEGTSTQVGLIILPDRRFANYLTSWVCSSCFRLLAVYNQSLFLPRASADDNLLTQLLSLNLSVQLGSATRSRALQTRKVSSMKLCVTSRLRWPVACSTATKMPPTQPPAWHSATASSSIGTRHSSSRLSGT